MGLNTGNYSPVDRPAWDHLRQGVNENHNFGTYTATEWMALVVDGAANTNQHTPAELSGNFAASSRLASSATFQYTSEYRMKRQSPVSRRGQLKPIY